MMSVYDTARGRRSNALDAGYLADIAKALQGLGKDIDGLKGVEVDFGDRHEFPLRARVKMTFAETPHICRGYPVAFRTSEGDDCQRLSVWRRGYDERGPLYHVVNMHDAVTQEGTRSLGVLGLTADATGLSEEPKSASDPWNYTMCVTIENPRLKATA